MSIHFDIIILMNTILSMISTILLCFMYVLWLIESSKKRRTCIQCQLHYFLLFFSFPSVQFSVHKHHFRLQPRLRGNSPSTEIQSLSYLFLPPFPIHCNQSIHSPRRRCVPQTIYWSHSAGLSCWAFVLPQFQTTWRGRILCSRNLALSTGGKSE